MYNRMTNYIEPRMEYPDFFSLILSANGRIGS